MQNNKLKVLVMTSVLVIGIIVSSAYALDLDKMKAYFLKADYPASVSEGEKILAGVKSHQAGLDELYYLLGLSYLKEGKYLRASDIFEIILGEFKNSRFTAQSQIALGDAYFLKGDYSKAQGIYNEQLLSSAKTKFKAGIYYRLSQIGKRTKNQPQENKYREMLKSEFPNSPEFLVDTQFLPVIKQPEIKPESSLVAQSGSYYTVQVGAFSGSANAQRLVEKLQVKGYSAYLKESVSKGKTIYKVKVGQVSSLWEAKNLEKKLIREGYPTKIVF